MSIAATVGTTHSETLSRITPFLLSDFSPPSPLKNISRFLTAALLVILSGCELVSTTNEHERIVEGISFDELFRDASPAEIAAVEADWAARTTPAMNVQVRHLEVITLGDSQATVVVVSHRVGGVVHYGAIISPIGGQNDSRPVVVYAHGGDEGVSIDEHVLFVLGFFEEISDRFVYVVPSYRSEELRYDDLLWKSGGEPSPWDYDVDDTMSLLSVTEALSPSADLSRVAVLGLSRGAGVGLLMGIRDSRVDQVIDFFGPTDFFGVFIQDVVEEALRGSLRDLPGLEHLNTAFIQPLKSGAMTIEGIRPELIRRSPVLFVDRLDQVQIHHGTADQTVPVSQGQSLVSAMQAAGRDEPDFEYYIYPGGTHSPFALESSFERAAAFLSRMLNE